MTMYGIENTVEVRRRNKRFRGVVTTDKNIKCNTYVLKSKNEGPEITTYK